MLAMSPPLMTDELPLRAEPAELESAEQFRVVAPGEVHALMHQLAEHHEFVCIYLDKSDRFALSAMLAAQPNRLLLDLPNGFMRAEVLTSEVLYCVASLQRVKLEFEVRAPMLVEWEGRPAMATQLPSTVLRLQRRDYYRLTVPMGNPLSCYISTGHGDEVEISLVDISVGGVGILGFVPGLRLRPGQHLHHVRIELPETGTVMCDLEIRTSFDVTLRNGIRTVRTGAQFINPATATQSLIQRYITRIERERIAHEVG